MLLMVSENCPVIDCLVIAPLIEISASEYDPPNSITFWFVVVPVLDRGSLLIQNGKGRSP